MIEIHGHWMEGKWQWLLLDMQFLVLLVIVCLMGLCRREGALRRLIQCE